MSHRKPVDLQVAKLEDKTEHLRVRCNDLDLRLQKLEKKLDVKPGDP
jgi:hypothetical protein